MSMDEPDQARSRLRQLLPWLDARTERVLAWLIAPLVVIVAYIVALYTLAPQRRQGPTPPDDD